MLAGHYHAGLVALSVAVAITASYAALDLAGRVTASAGRARRLWLAVGACSMGGGIWAMHYIGMLAFQLPVPVLYDLPTVGISYAVAVLASGLALSVASRDCLSYRATSAASLAMGLGIAAMHFIGMEAMRFAGGHAYHPWGVAASVGLAIAASFVAVRLSYHFRRESRTFELGKAASAATMGLAIAGMHYTGMAAAHFHGGPAHPSMHGAVDVTALGTFGVTALSLLALAATVLWARVGRRLDWQADAIRVSEQRYRELFERSLAGVYRSSLDGRLLDCNAALARMLGYRRDDVLKLAAVDLFAAVGDRERWTELLVEQRALPQFEHRLRRRDGSLIWVIESASLVDLPDGGSVIEGTIVDISARRDAERRLAEATATLTASLERYRTLVETTNAVPWEVDATNRLVRYMSPQAHRLFGYDAATLVGHPFPWEVVHDDDRGRVQQQIAALAGRGPGHHLETEFRLKKPQGGSVLVRAVITSALGDDRSAMVLRGITFDITSQRQLELDLQQAQKLESVGRLAAGIAHEINTPVQFVNDSLDFVRDGMKALDGLIATYRQLATADAPESRAATLASVAAAERAADLDYLREEVPKAIALSLDGLARVTRIVRSMKEFAHPDQAAMTAVDLNRAIESTLVVARHEYRYVATVALELADLPPVICHAGEINQAVLNVLVNAAHAIADRVRGTSALGRITVRTRREGDDVVISIGDTGLGIPEAIQSKVFDPFFTTKDVGRGTGQGLAIARAVVVEKHGGDLRFETVPGDGTTFYLRLPLSGRGAADAAA